MGIGLRLDGGWNATFHAWVNKVAQKHNHEVEDIVEACANYFEISPSRVQRWYDKEGRPSRGVEEIILEWLYNYHDTGVPKQPQ